MDATGALTPALPSSGPGPNPAIAPRTAPLPRSASEATGGPSAPRTLHARRAPAAAAARNADAAEPRDMWPDIERGFGAAALGASVGDAAAAAAALARECQEAKLETEFLRRIEALEAKVGDRDGLLAKLSRQQARLDRLETLARENEILRAQVRGDQRRDHFDQRQAAASTAGGGKAPGGGKERQVRRPAVDRQNSGRQQQHQPREVKIVTAQEEALSLLEETGDVDSARETARPAPGGLPAGLPARQVHRCSSSGTFSPPAEKPAVAPRRMFSAPQEYLPSEGLKAQVGQPGSELESRLEELELALGLQPGVCAKSSTQRPVMRERSV